MGVWISALWMSVAVVLTPLPETAQEGRSRSILVLDQSEPTGPLSLQIFFGLRAGINADACARTTFSPKASGEPLQVRGDQRFSMSRLS